MAKTYTMKRHSQRWNEVTLYVIETDRSDRQAASRSALPLVVGSDGWSGGGCGSNYAVAMTILLDYFGDEESGERKAATMAWAFANQMTKFGREWRLTESEVNDIVVTILMTAANFVRECDEQIVIEEACGERRDLLRQAALVETISDRSFLE
jgi:hypothetical protein